MFNYLKTLKNRLLFRLNKSRYKKWKRLKKDRRRDRDTYTFVRSRNLLNKDKPKEAWALIQRDDLYKKNEIFLFDTCATLLQGLGRKKFAFDLFLEQQEKKFPNLKNRQNIKRIVSDIWPGAIGHIATIDYLCKQNIIENANSEILFFANTPIANEYLWEQYRKDYKFISYDDWSSIDEFEREFSKVHYLFPRQNNGEIKYFWEAAAKTYQEWESTDRPASFKIQKQIELSGNRNLESVGIGENDWFVSLHVRSRTSKAHHSGLHDVLNADIDDYIPAIQEITDRGGWVIRLGDPSMPTLPKMERVFDYCHSDMKSDWMDIFLLAKARFFIGTSSGPAYVPPLFNVPCVLTNWWPPAQRPWHKRDIFIPKLYKNFLTGELLPLSISLSEPFSYCHSQNYLLNEFGVVVRDNCKHEIVSAVQEMIAILTNNEQYEESDYVIRQQVNEIYDKYEAYGSANLAKKFVQDHLGLLK